jgi:hypothetical protein
MTKNCAGPRESWMGASGRFEPRWGGEKGVGLVHVEEEGGSGRSNVAVGVRRR